MFPYKVIQFLLNIVIVISIILTWILYLKAWLLSLETH